MSPTRSLTDQVNLLCRNAIDVIDREDLLNRLTESQKSGKALRVKAGFDPSAPDIHLGHTVLLRKLRQFQDLGHKVIFIIGGYTAMIGDPTGKSATRPVLSKEEVEKNAKTYQSQAFKILDKDPKKLEVVNNSDWLGKLSLQQFLADVATRFTVARILERDDFEKRMGENQPISIRELMYPMLQAYDSIMVNADVELGGSDQKFNLLAGRDLQRSMNQRSQIVMTFPLLVGLDGTNKMSKSLGNYVGVMDSSKDMFGKIMSIPDALMEIYFNLLTEEDGSAIMKEVATGKRHPRDTKKYLAEKIVAFYHGQEIAKKESDEFDRIFKDKKNPETVEEIIVDADSISLVEALKKAGAVTTSSDAYRLIQQGGVTVDGQKVTDTKAVVLASKAPLIKAGKKSFFKLKKA